MSRSIAIVTDELLKLAGEYIRFPATAAEVATAKADFWSHLQMPGILGAIDGTHIAIVKPKEDGHLYFNRKAHYSLNVLAVCDANLVFVFADANYPGSVHDSAIWQMTVIDEMMPENAFLLGDSGFPSNRYILTPSPHAPEGSQAAKYNVAHKHARNVVERAFGVLKMRFRCLHKHRVLHYAPAKAAKLVYACMVLHNICRHYKLALQSDDDEEQMDEEVDDVTGGEAVEVRGANAGQQVAGLVHPAPLLKSLC